MTARDELHRVAIELANLEVECRELADRRGEVDTAIHENKEYWRLNKEYWRLVNDVANGAE